MGVHTQPPDLSQIKVDHGLKTIKTLERVLDNFPVDVFFIALHGTPGEDGTIQGILDLLAVPYTGSGVLASALAMDKAMSKTIFRQAGVQTADWIFINYKIELFDHQLLNQINTKIGFPLVVKPNNEGSTVGFSIVQKPEELLPALKFAQEYGNETLIETYIPGRELTVSILENQVLPVIEIIPKHGAYDYECKYTKGMTEYQVPAHISDEIRNHVHDQALKAFHALKCTDYARVDFRVSADERTYCLEVNTLPGMTETSLVPKSARAAGIEFDELVEKILMMAIQRKVN
jgi:D-alanine-D-alanine ligase